MQSISGQIKYEGEKAAAADQAYKNAWNNVRQLYEDALRVSAWTRTVASPSVPAFGSFSFGMPSALGGSATFGSATTFGTAAVNEVDGSNPGPGSPDVVANVVSGDGGIATQSPTATGPEDLIDVVPSSTTPDGDSAHEDTQTVDTYYLDEM